MQPFLFMFRGSRSAPPFARRSRPDPDRCKMLRERRVRLTMRPCVERLGAMFRRYACCYCQDKEENNKLLLSNKLLFKSTIRLLIH